MALRRFGDGSYSCLSSDIKPSKASPENKLYELDTNKVYYHDGSDWREFREGTVVEPYTFQNARTTTGDGEKLTVGTLKQVNVAITGTSTSFKVKFFGELNGVTTTLYGFVYRPTDIDSASETTIKDEVWMVGIKGYDKVWFRVDSIGNGNITVKGNVVG